MYLIELFSRAHRSIASCRNSGLGDNLSAAASAWCYARKTGRDLAICWFHSRYLRDQRENAFSRFFTLPDEIEGVAVCVEPWVDRISAFVLMHWAYLVPFPDLVGMFAWLLRRTALARHVSNRFYPVGYAWRRRQNKQMQLIRSGADTPRHLLVASGCYPPQADMQPFFDALRLQPHLSTQVDEFAARHFRGKTVIGVHIRYYDPALPPSDHSASWADPEQTLALCVNRIEAAIEAMAVPDCVVFLATDSRKVHDFIRTRLQHVVCLEKPWGIDPARELHEELPVETAEASVAEMFLLARCHLLVRLPTRSWFSHYASLYVRQFDP